jgi:hypothetical protein
LEVATLHRGGLPVLRSIPVRMHAVAITPAEPLGPSLFLPSGGGLPPNSAESASASPFSRPARRSLALRPACSPSHPAVTLYIRGSVEFVASPDAPIATGWSDSCRAGFTPAGDVRLFTAHRIGPVRRSRPREWSPPDPAVGSLSRPRPRPQGEHALEAKGEDPVG